MQKHINYINQDFTHSTIPYNGVRSYIVVMKIQCKDCTLTVARDGEFIPISYSCKTNHGQNNF